MVTKICFYGNDIVVVMQIHVEFKQQKSTQIVNVDKDLKDL